MTDKAQEADRMLLDLVQLLPTDLAEVTVVIAVVLAIIGGGLLLVGVRISRPVVTLLTVLIGAGIGLNAPKWFNWNVSGAGPAVAGAVVLGVSGFVLHRMWVGLSLGLVISLWATLAIWVTMNDGKGWSWPACDSGTSCWSYAKEIWASIPADMTRLIPWTCSVALVSGLAACILWPKLTLALNWSLIGTTMVLGFGIGAIAMSKKPWLAQLPQRSWVQVLSVTAIVALSFAIQWKLAPRAKFAPKAPESKKEAD